MILVVLARDLEEVEEVGATVATDVEVSLNGLKTDYASMVPRVLMAAEGHVRGHRLSVPAPSPSRGTRSHTLAVMLLAAVHGTTVPGSTGDGEVVAAAVVYESMAPGRADVT